MNKHGEVIQNSSPNPPFKISDIRAAIPKHCWIKNPWWSLGYVIRDCLLASGLVAMAFYIDNRIFWPLYWTAQGSVFMGLFVIGHDWSWLLEVAGPLVICNISFVLNLIYSGHGSFSNNRRLNNLVGHILLTFVLTPYHGFRIGHRTHHQNHGHADKDEAWVPLPEKIYKNLDHSTKFMRFTLPFPLLAHPLYMLYRSPGKDGSHFNPNNELFLPSERNNVIFSTVCWTLMIFVLLFLSIVIGPVQIIYLYWIPYWIFVMWISSVTYLNHHGHEHKVPWYRGQEWNYLKGALTTVDRDYGWFSYIHHHLGTHVIHHLFPQIPHYRLPEATEAAKPVLGIYYKEPKKSGVIPFHLISDIIRSLDEDHYVNDTGDVVFYQTDSELLESSWNKNIHWTLSKILKIWRTLGNFDK